MTTDTQSLPQTQESSLRPRRVVLVVEASQKIRERMQRMLAREPYDLILTSRGEDGLTAARMQRPDLILLDTVFPDMDMREFTRRLAEENAGLELPTVLVTAYQLVGAAFPRPGKAWYLPKPFDAGLLRTKLCEVLAEVDAARAASVPLSMPAAASAPEEAVVLDDLQDDPLAELLAEVADEDSAVEADPVPDFSMPTPEEIAAIPAAGMKLRHGLLPAGEPRATSLLLLVEENGVLQEQARIDYAQLLAVGRVNDRGIKLMFRQRVTVHMPVVAETEAVRNSFLDLIGKGRVSWLAGVPEEIKVEGLPVGL